MPDCKASNNDSGLLPHVNESKPAVQGPAISEDHQSRMESLEGFPQWLGEVALWVPAIL